MRTIVIFAVCLAGAVMSSCGSSEREPESAGRGEGIIEENGMEEKKTETIVLGGGCFWCLEAAFEIVPGVLDVENGYSGGTRESPTYEQVCSGLTGHAEVVRITFDPGVVTLDRLLDLFWRIHDPTSLNRQGADIGTQYRSVILYSDPRQKATAQASLDRIAGELRDPVVTELEPLETFWKAEEYHQDYFRRNPNMAYCRAVVASKAAKARDWIAGE